MNDPEARPEILFLQRESHQPEEIRAFRLENKYRDVHVAFPGGRADDGDEGGQYTGTLSTEPGFGDFILSDSSSSSLATDLGRDRS